MLINGKTLFTILRQTRNSIDHYSSRYALGGVRFEVDDNGKELHAIATNGRSLLHHVSEFKASNWEPTEKAIDTGFKQIVDVEPLWKKRNQINQKSDVWVSIVGQTMQFKWHNGANGKRAKTYNVQCPFVPGRFPDWRYVIAMSDCVGTGYINPAQWVDAFDSWTPNFRICVNGRTRATYSGPKFVVDDHIGTDFDITPNIDQVIAHLRLRDEKKLLVEYHGSECPLVFKTPSSTWLTMPMSKNA